VFAKLGERYFLFTDFLNVYVFIRLKTMKKMYTLVVATMFFGVGNAQGIALDFEEFNLSPNTFYNGSDSNGDIYLDGLQLTNNYNATWDAWNGFSVSNVVDTTTAGFSNQYASFSGGGYQSSQYGVFYPSGTIQTPGGGMVLDSFFITNTTFSALSMRNGDAFSKKFGSVYGPDGVTLDGTNGEDFFKVWVIAEDFIGTSTDSLEVYLADYRFADSLADYILKDWIKVDLTVFDFYVHRLKFRFESSDMGAWGINTPTFFAIDNIYHSGSWSVPELTSFHVNVYPNPMEDGISITGNAGWLAIKDIFGKTIFSAYHSGHSTIDVSALAAGIYTIELSNSNGRGTQRVLKR
jgi:hypothetical protein